MIHCPVCSRKGVGRVGADQYYCWDCCVEFVLRGDSVKVFQVESDGSLSAMGASGPGLINTQGTEGVVGCGTGSGMG